MQSGRSMSLQDRATNRGTTKQTRSVDEKRRTIAESARYKQEVKTSATPEVDNRGTDSETKRKLQGPTTNKNKPKVISFSKADENRVSYSIQKLLSVYQTAKTDKTADERRPQVVETKKSRVNTRPSRSNVTKIPELQSNLKNGPGNLAPSKRVTPASKATSDVKDFGVQHRKTDEAHTRRTLHKPKLTPKTSKTESSAVGVEVKEAEKDTKPCDEIIPLLAPDRTTHSPLTQIHSFIANYLEEDSEDGKRTENKLKLFVPESSVNTLPVCSKRATDNIPSSDLVRPEVTPSTREFIIMLRRRNSEPYSPKSCILQYSRREEDHPLSSSGSDGWGFGYENYYFWEHGPIHPSKPYWEVSLLKSSSTFNSTAGLLSLTPAKDKSEILINGNFGPRTRERAVVPGPVKSWSRDLHSCKSLVRTIPFVNSMETVTTLPCKTAQVETATEPETRVRGMSKDDHYKHPAHLLVYVKTSQKKLVSLDSNVSRGESIANRKVHKIKKVLGSVSEVRGTSSCKSIVVAVLSVALLLTGGLAFFVYFLARSPTLFNLTPPVPGLLRRC